MTERKRSFVGAWEEVRAIIDRNCKKYPRHFGALDITEVISFGDIADNYGLTDKGYNDLIDKAQKYYNSKISNPKKGGIGMAKRKRKYTRRMRVFGLPIIPLAIVGGLIWYFAKRA